MGGFCPLNLHAEDKVLGIRVSQDIGMDHLEACVHQGPDKFGEVGVALFEAEMDAVAAKLLLSEIKCSNYTLTDIHVGPAISSQEQRTVRYETAPGVSL